MTDPVLVAVVERDVVAACWLLTEDTDAERHDDPSTSAWASGSSAISCRTARHGDG